MGYQFTKLSYNKIFTTDSNFSQIEIDKPQSNDYLQLLYPSSY